MNRQIKFRVWDFINEKFDDQIYYAGEQFGHPSSCDWVAQQFTGLFDKNGKDIYEGDILVIPENDPMSTSGNALVVVEYEFGGFGYRDTLTKKFDTLYGIIGQTETDNCAEIIGNIFDNKDLLKS